MGNFIRANQKRVPKYRRRKMLFASVVFNGREYNLGRYDSRDSKAKYHRLVAEWEASGRSPNYGLPEGTLTIRKLVFSYLAHAKQYYGDTSRGEYANMQPATNRLDYLYGDTLASEFGPQQLKAVRKTFIDGGNGRKYINASVKRIVRVFRWAVSEGMLPAEVPNALAMLPGLQCGRTEAPEGSGVLPVPREIVDATLPHLSPVVRAIVELQRLTASRPGEICIMRPCDVDRSGDVWAYLPSSHKTKHRGKDRVIYIGPKGQDVLRPFLLRPNDWYCFSPKDTDRERLAYRGFMRKTPLSCGNRPGTNRKRHPMCKPGEVYPTASYGNAIRRACRVAFPIPLDIAGDSAAVEKWKREHYWSPNRLRHSTATELRRQYGLEAAQVTLGHASADVTQIYAERDSGFAVKIAREVG